MPKRVRKGSKRGEKREKEVKTARNVPLLPWGFLDEK